MKYRTYATASNAQRRKGALERQCPDRRFAVQVDPQPTFRFIVALVDHDGRFMAACG